MAGRLFWGWFTLIHLFLSQKTMPGVWGWVAAAAAAAAGTAGGVAAALLSV
jgi:hypothetical protein